MRRVKNKDKRHTNDHAYCQNKCSRMNIRSREEELNITCVIERSAVEYPNILFSGTWKRAGQEAKSNNNAQGNWTYGHLHYEIHNIPVPLI